MFGKDEISNNLIRRRLRLITIIISIGFCLLVLRLGHLQIICSRYYTERSENNRILPIRLIPPRGVLYDRHGKEPLADNETAFDVCIAPDKADSFRNVDERRREAFLRLELTPEAIVEKLEASHGASFEPIVIKEDVDKDVVAYFAENSLHMPEVIIRARPKRRYKNLAAHIIGYAAPVLEKDLQNGYMANDVIGKSGIEGEYERYLKGEAGFKMVEVNAYGHLVRDLQMPIRAEPGQSLNLTVDMALQRRAEELLEGKTGSIVAIDPRSGEILAMASKPDFDPNVFAGPCSKEDWDQLVEDPGNPLINRPIMGEYPPGSTFKIVTTTAALQEGKIDEGTSFYCNGRFNLGKRRFNCHKASGHGRVSIHAALAESCNVFFYNVAYNRGVNVALMHKYALMYGLGKKTGVDISGERRGFVPEKDTVPGDKINMCIGQGRLLVTPIQMADLICVIANRGFAYRPHFVNPTQDYKPEIMLDIRKQVSPRTIEVIRDALKEVVERGYSRQANLPDHHSAGKTGSAQNPHGDSHAWFIGFAPFDKPEIAVSVLVENAGLGSENAAPIAGQIFAQYFYGDQTMMADGKGNSNQSAVTGH